MVKNKYFIYIPILFLVLFVFEIAVAESADKGSMIPAIVTLLLDEPGGGDTTAPTVPTGLSATPASPSQINLQWNASYDNVGVTGYKIYRGGVYPPLPPLYVYLQSVAGTSATDPGLSPSTNYCYKVLAYDAANNESARSTQQCATTRSGTQTITLNPQYDNAVYTSSLDPNEANSVFTNHTLPVGCLWSYDYIAAYPEGFWVQNFLCGRALVKFNLSTLSGKTIDSATLKLMASSVGVGTAPRQWHIRAQATSWSTSTVTWNIVNKSQYYTDSEIILYPPGFYGQSKNFEINVTSIVQNWASGTWNNHGLLFDLHDYTFPLRTSFDNFEFYSLEDPGQDWPKLIVTYH